MLEKALNGFSPYSNVVETEIYFCCLETNIKYLTKNAQWQLTMLQL